MMITRVLSILLLFLTVLPARADWITESNKYAMQVLHGMAVYYPEFASGQGLSEYDTGVMDLNPEVYTRQQASSRQLLTQMREQLAQAEHPKVRQDLRILIQSVTDRLETERIQRDYLLPFINVHQDLFSSFKSLLDPRNDANRYPSALVRLRKYNGTAQGFTPVSTLARARTEERFTVKSLVGPYQAELEGELANAPRYVAGIRSLFEDSGLTGWEQDLALLEEQLAAYAGFIETGLLPRARTENLLPAVVYADNLKNYGVRATPESLIEDAQSAYQFIRSEMKALARRIAEQRGWEDRRLVPVMLKLKEEQVAEDEILDLYKQRLAAIEGIIRRENIISLPDREASIRLATEAEAAAIPASFMSPPQLLNNTGQLGEFVLVQSNPTLKGDAKMDDWGHDAITWALTVHEARPGHELQFAKLVENGTSLARALFAFNSANAEGWGLYAESIMHEYLPLEGQLFNLFTRLMRAARMFMDPMVNTGQLSPDQAVAFMTEQMALSRAMATSEADRYAFRMPGQATAYYYGYSKLMRLRTEVELSMGDSFDQRAYHDFILEQGLLPPEMLREAVLAEFVR